MSVIKNLLRKLRNKEESINNPYPSSKAAFDRYKYLENQNKKEMLDEDEEELAYNDLQEKTEKSNYLTGTKLIQDEIDRTSDKNMRSGLVKKYLDRIAKQPFISSSLDTKPIGILEEIEKNKKDYEKKQNYEKNQIDKISKEIVEDAEEESNYLNRKQARDFSRLPSAENRVMELARERQNKERKNLDIQIKSNMDKIAALEAKDILTASEEKELESLKNITNQLLSGPWR